MIIVESGLRASGLRLLTLHDELLATGYWRVLAPCTHQKRCPLLRLDKRPWCHFHLRWNPGATVRRVAEPLGLSCDTASFSYLALERIHRAGDSPEADTGGVERARVIGDRMAVRGGKDGIYICHDGKRATLRRLPAGVRRGDRLRMEGPAAIETHWPA